jgi:hypothetical protein
VYYQEDSLSYLQEYVLVWKRVLLQKEKLTDDVIASQAEGRLLEEDVLLQQTRAGLSFPAIKSVKVGHPTLTDSNDCAASGLHSFSKPHA